MVSLSLRGARTQKFSQQLLDLVEPPVDLVKPSVDLVEPPCVRVEHQVGFSHGPGGGVVRRAFSLGRTPAAGRQVEDVQVDVADALEELGGPGESARDSGRPSRQA